MRDKRLSFWWALSVSAATHMAAYLGVNHSTGCHSRSPDYIPGLCEVVVGDLKLSLPRVAERGSKKSALRGIVPIRYLR